MTNNKEVVRSKIISEIQTRYGELKITIEGDYQPELAHYGGMDLQLLAIRNLISNIDTKFAEERYPDIDNIVIALLLNEIGESVRESYERFFDCDEQSNIDLLKMFINDISDAPHIKKILDNDTVLLEKEREELY